MDSGETGILKLKALAIWSAVEGQPGAGLAGGHSGSWILSRPGHDHTLAS